MKKNSFTLYFMSCFFFLLLSCGAQNAKISLNKTYVRVENNSTYDFSEVALFSLTFKDISRGKKSKYKVLNFNQTKDDPMLYITTNKKRFAIYVSADSLKGYFSYIVDSLDIDQRYLYTRRIKN